MARGISTSTVARRAAALAIAAAAATGLSACGAGQVTATDQKQTAIAGINVDAGDLALRDLQVQFDSSEGYEAGGSAPLRVWISNEGTESVSLVGVATEAADAVTLVSADAAGTEQTTSAPAADETSEAPEGEDASETPEGEEGSETPEGEDGSETAEGEDGAEETTDESTDGASEEATDDASAEPTDEPAAGDDLTGETQFEIEIAPNDYVRLDQRVEGSDYLLLEGLGEELLPGDSVEVTFLFSNGAEVTVDLPVGEAAEPGDREYEEHPGVSH